MSTVFSRFLSPTTLSRLLLASACLTLNTAYANLNDSGWWLSAEGGYAWSLDINQNKIESMPTGFPPAPTYYDDYFSNRRQNNISLGLGVGYEFRCLCRKWFPAYRIGLLGNYVTNTKVNGKIIKFLETAEYAYDYKIQTDVVWIDNQIDLAKFAGFSPFIDVAAGAATSWSNSYGESSIAPIVRDSAAFGARRSTSFAWRAGAGISYNKIWPQLTIEVLFLHSDLGTAVTGASHMYPTASRGLSMRLVSNEVALGLRYKIC